MPVTSIPDGTYRIRQAGAKSEVANMISNGKKCHYVQIGIELFHVANMDEAKEFVAGKGLVADPMSLDFGVEPEPVVTEEAPTEDAAPDESE